jgi:hypothetical protein
MDVQPRSPSSARTALPTAPLDDGLATSRRALWWRRAVLAALGLFVLVALTGQLGVRTDTVADRDGALSVTVRYADRARGALAAPFAVVVVRRGGFDGPIEVRTDQRYLALFDDNGFEPEPAEMSTAGGQVIWTFDPPPGEALTVLLDARVEPGVFGRREGSTTVRASGDEVTVGYTTWVAP